MEEISITVGGKAGDGIRAATTLLGRILSRYGYRIFVYDDYPSLIRGGHNFSILRAAKKKILANTKQVDLMIAFDGKTLDRHKVELKKEGIVVYDSGDGKLKERVKSLDLRGEGIDFRGILKDEGAKNVMKNSAAIGAVSKIIGIDFPTVREVLSGFVREAELNVRVAEKAYSIAETLIPIERLEQEILPVLSGNDAIALGAMTSGLEAYYAYPMTPSTSILHHFASFREKYGLIVVQPENEIAVMLMALGSAYSGRRTMVASSGGGFALMVEGLSLAGQAEIPVVVVVAQRAGPSTGVPTYTMQSDLHFIVNAGHGEFPRFVVAPGDAEEAFSYTALAMDIAWKFQIPAFVLTDKHLSESLFSFDFKEVETIERKAIDTCLWNGEGDYSRYRLTEDGISPLAFPSQAIVKSNSYAHDEYGITTEDPEKISLMQEKRLRKMCKLQEEVENPPAAKVYGRSEDAIVTWGSTKGVCIEAAEELGLKVVQPIMLEPFPAGLAEELEGRKVVVEVNATGQLARLLRGNGIEADDVILKYDGRPFFLEELVERLKEVFR